MFQNIKIGDRLEISLLSERHIGKTYVSQVEEVLNDQKVLVHMPISYGQLVKLPLKEKYAVLFFTEKGMIFFEAAITGYKKESSFNYMMLELLTEGERMQRREFFRFPCLLPIKFAPIQEDEKQENVGNEILLDGIIKDFGGGGVRFVTNESFSEKAKLKCVMILDDICLVVIGDVLHKQFFPKSNYKYQYRVQFTRITQADQETIVQFIFNEQRKNIQKTRG